MRPPPRARSSADTCSWYRPSDAAVVARAPTASGSFMFQRSCSSRRALMRPHVASSTGARIVFS
jgi:putative SOS response-associated peptidase YedK